jgi:hypothetical protein
MMESTEKIEGMAMVCIHGKQVIDMRGIGKRAECVVLVLSIWLMVVSHCLHYM